MRIIFFTTSTLSDVQEVSSRCVRHFFPGCEHIVIDGRGKWFGVWYEWLDIAKDMQADWFVHLDEDCFIVAQDRILETMELMRRQNHDIAGCPDGYNEYRSGNHMALNSFFMILNRKCIDAWHQRDHVPQFKKEWIREYPFVKKGQTNHVYDMEFGSSGKPVGKIYVPGTEPYYDFFWVLKEAGLSFLYLEPAFGAEFQTTNLLDDSVIHMWYQRWRNQERVVGLMHTMPNKQRFDGMIRKIQFLLEP